MTWEQMLPNGRNAIGMSKDDIAFHKRGRKLNKNEIKSNWINSGNKRNGPFKLRITRTSIKD